MAVLIVIGGATAWFWDEIKPLFTSSMEADPRQVEVSTQDASASGANSTAVNASDASSVSLGKDDSDRVRPSQSKANSGPINQSAEAQDGGNAVNAADSAEVTVQQ